LNLNEAQLKDSLVRLVRRRHRRQIKARSGSVFLIVLLLAASAVVTWKFARQQPVASLARPSSTVQAGKVDPGKNLTESLYIAMRPSRPAYPYSVIPGGIDSGEELRQIAERDPVVAQHFKGFDYQLAHVVTVSEKQLVYVAYRKGNKVYWTRKKMPLHPGETLISDGKITARTRCGNRVAVAPLGPPGPMDPLMSDLDQPLFSNEMVTNAVEPQPETYAAALPGPPDVGNALQPTHHRKGFLPLFFLPFAGFPGGSASAHTPLAVTPEPGSLLLLSSGLAGIYWKLRKSRRKQ
jgi:hypothetical protein